MIKKEEKKITEYKVTFVGLSYNEAQAVEGIIHSINQLKLRDKMPMDKLEEENKVDNVDLVLYRQIHTTLMNLPFKSNLGERVQKRIKDLEQKNHERNLRIKNHKSNIDFLTEYVESLREKIKEEVDHDNQTVTYTYDTDYFRPFLDLGGIIFEMSFEEQKNKEESELVN